MDVSEDPKIIYLISTFALYINFDFSFYIKRNRTGIAWNVVWLFCKAYSQFKLLEDYELQLGRIPPIRGIYARAQIIVYNSLFKIKQAEKWGEAIF